MEVKRIINDAQEAEVRRSSINDLSCPDNHYLVPTLEDPPTIPPTTLPSPEQNPVFQEREKPDFLEKNVDDLTLDELRLLAAWAKSI